MFCPWCGSENDPDARYCAECGRELDGTVSTVPGPSAGTVPPVPVPPVNPDKGRGGRIALLVVAIIAVVALVVAGTVVVVRAIDGNSSSISSDADGAESGGGTDEDPAGDDDNDDADADDTNRTDDDKDGVDADDGNDASDENADGAARTLDKDAVDAIVARYSETDAAVAVMTADGLRSYSSRYAESRYVAAGLYLPVYLAYTAKNPGRPSDSAGEMLRSMNNDAANAVIDGIGGLDALNDWLSDNRYSRTTFGRKFGDVAASERGYENYTSADDAARMLSACINDGSYELMNYDIASEGVRIPAGATVHAHRGMGIQDAYNDFVVISDGGTSVGVAVMTRDLGKEQAAGLTSDILDVVWTSMLAGQSGDGE